MAEACIRSGRTAIVDAVFSDPSHRRAIGRLAREAAVPFTGVWLEVPFDVAAARLSARTGDASDADVAVLQLQRRRAFSAPEWMLVDGRRFERESAVTLETLEATTAARSSDR